MSKPGPKPGSKIVKALKSIGTVVDMNALKNADRSVVVSTFIGNKRYRIDIYELLVPKHNTCYK